MALRSKFVALALAAIISSISVVAVDVDAQAWRRPYRPPPVVRTPPPRPMPPMRPPVRPSVGSPNVRPGPAIRAPIARPGGIRPTSPSLGGRPNAIAIRPTTLPKPMAGVSRPSGGIAIKQGANVSLKPLAPTSALMSRLKGSVSGPALSAGSRPVLRANTRVIQAKRLTATKQSTASSIQRVRAALAKSGKVLASNPCAAVNRCPASTEKFYQKAKLGQDTARNARISETQSLLQKARPYLRSWDKNDPFKFKLSAVQRHYIVEQITSNPEAGRQIMSTLSDPKYSTGGWVKRQIEIPMQTGSHKSPPAESSRVLIHYMHNPSTGSVEQIKLKPASNSPVLP